MWRERGWIFFPLKVNLDQLKSLGLASFLISAGKADIIKIPPLSPLYSLFSKLVLFLDYKKSVNIFYRSDNFNNFYFI